MTDISDRMTRVEEAQYGLNTYLPLLLKRFEGIEDRLEADLKATEQKLETDLKETRQELKATEQKLEADLKATEQKLETNIKATEQKLDDIRKENRDGNRNILISVLATAVTLIVTGIVF